MEPRILSEFRTPDGCRLRLIEYAPGVRQRPHAHDRGSLTLVLRGNLVEACESGEDRASGLSVVAKAAGHVHSNAFGPVGATTLQIELPGDSSAFDVAPWMHHAAARWDHAGPSCRALLRLLGLLNDVGGPRAGDTADDLVGCALAALESPGPVRAAIPAWLVESRVALESESTPIVVIAQRAGVHPVYLARRFRAAFGVSPAAHRGRSRVHRAACALLDGGASLVAVAMDAGFCDQSHMSHAVLAVTGMTPRALRQMRLPAGPTSERGAA